MPTSVFDIVKTIPAADIARHAGLTLSRKGKREWTCCPIHGERTPSLCFFPDGGWRCFGCNRGGDGVDLYAAVYHVTPLDAAKQIAAAFGMDTPEPAAPQPARPTVHALQETVESWRERKADKLVKILHATAQTMEDLHQGATDSSYIDSPRFADAQEMHDLAQLALYNLDTATPEQLIDEMAAEIAAERRQRNGNEIA